MLFVMCPGQENQTWSTLRKAPILLDSPNPGSSPKIKSFNNYSMIIDALVKVHNEAESETD